MCLVIISSITIPHQNASAQAKAKFRAVQWLEPVRSGHQRQVSVNVHIHGKSQIIPVSTFVMESEWFDFYDKVGHHKLLKDGLR